MADVLVLDPIIFDSSFDFLCADKIEYASEAMRHE